MMLKCFNYYTRNSGSILSLPKLAFIKCDILTLKFAHFLNLVEVNHEAFLVNTHHKNESNMNTEYYSSILEISKEFDFWSTSSLFIEEIVRELFYPTL